MASTIIFTTAYNAEKTLSRTIESVLTQSRGDFVYYLADNGSSDKTGQIIQKYAEKDARIFPAYHKTNNLHILWEYFPVLCESQLEQYFTVIDADDTLKTEYLEQLLNFIQKNSLDIAVCGNDMIDAQSNQLVSQRLLKDNLILEKAGFEQYFPYYHQFMRTTWGKIFKISLLRQCCYDGNIKAVSYGGDTLFSMGAFRVAKRVGILSQSLHNYYLSPKSSSYKFNPKRIFSDQTLHRYTVDYLKQFGEISARNWDFLYSVYMNALRDTLNVLFGSDISNNEKLSGVIDIFSHEYTKQLAAWKNFGASFGNIPEMTRQRSEIFAAAAAWLLSLDEVPDDQVEDYCTVGEFVSAAAGYADGWVFFKKLYVEFLTGVKRKDEAKLKLAELESLLPNDKEVAVLRENLTKPDGS